MLILKIFFFIEILVVNLLSIFGFVTQCQVILNCPMGFISVADNKNIHITYSKVELLKLNNTSAKTTRSTLLALRAANICTTKKTSRGTRGGRKPKQIPVLISPYFKNNNKQGDIRVTSNKINFRTLTNIDIDIDITSTKMIRTQCVDNLKVGYINAQSARCKTNEIVDLIQSQKLDIFFISESWLFPVGDEVIIKALTPPGYTLKSSPRCDRLGGGVAVIFRTSLENKIKVTEVPHFEHKSYQSIELSLNLDFKVYHFTCIYRPGYSMTNKITNHQFLDEFELFLDFSRTRSGLPILLGDFNFHFEIDSPDVNRFKELIASNDLIQLVHGPTHREGHTLDLVFANHDDTNIKSVNVVNQLISDHFTIFIDFDITKPKPSKRLVTSRNIKKIDISVFSSDVISVLENHDSIDISKFNEEITSVLDKHAPLVTRTISDRPFSPWYNLEVKAAKSERRKAERKWLKSGLTIHKNILKLKTKQWKHELISAKKQFYISKLEGSNSYKEIYKICNDLLGNVSSSPLPNNFELASLPDMFSNFFIEKTEKLRLSLDNFDIANDGDDFSGSFFSCFDGVDEDYIKNLIMKAPRKHCELDPIPTYLLVKCIDAIVPFITKIVNDSLVSGKVPDSFKTALVKPLLKKSNLDQNMLKNYRPVSNLSFISKICEKVALEQLLKHLHSNNLSEPLQSAYRAGHSTETALLKVVNDLLVQSDVGRVTLLNLLDLSSAFDTIDHGILLSRLNKSFGITGAALEWFQSYLSGRYQTVVIGDKKSAPRELKYGVPQGSVLGPILFTLYTQCLTKDIESLNFSYHLYADDTQLYTSFYPPDINQSVLAAEAAISSIKQWMNKNRLKLNEDKTESMLFGSSHSLKNIQVSSMDIDGTRISFSQSVRNLGVHLDPSLSMSSHVSRTIQCMYIHLRKISQIRDMIPLNVAKCLASSLVLSRMDYCNSLLAGVSSQNIRRLQVVQNNAARVVCRKKKRDSASPLLRELHWLPVQHRIDYKIATLCFKSLDGTAPPYICSLLSRYSPGRSLRSSADTTRLVVPVTRTKTFGDRSFGYYAPQLWNSLPRNIRESESISIFKRRLKTYFFDR